MKSAAQIESHWWQLMDLGFPIKVVTSAVGNNQQAVYPQSTAISLEGRAAIERNVAEMKN